MLNMKNYYNHLATILKHKYYVFLNCLQCGITYRGLKHDLSKLNPVEFFEYAENYTVGKSPVDVAKEKYGYCKAWLHHIHNNTHHWTYWFDLDISDYTFKPLKMPYWDVIEMICDWKSASQSYCKGVWTEDVFLNWYAHNKDNKKLILHLDTQNLVDDIMSNIKEFGWKKMTSVMKYKMFNFSNY